MFSSKIIIYLTIIYRCFFLFYFRIFYKNSNCYWSSAAAAGVDEAYVEQQLKLADAYLKLNNDDDAKKVISDLLSTADGAAADRIRQMAEAAGLGSLLGEKA